MSKLAGERPAFKHREKESPGFVATSLKRATGRRSEATATPAPGPLTPQSPRPEARDSLDRLMMSSARSVTVRRIERDGTFDRGEIEGCGPCCGHGCRLGATTPTGKDGLPVPVGCER